MRESWQGEVGDREREGRCVMRWMSGAVFACVTGDSYPKTSHLSRLLRELMQSQGVVGKRILLGREEVG